MMVIIGRGIGSYIHLTVPIHDHDALGQVRGGVFLVGGVCTTDIIGGRCVSSRHASPALMTRAHHLIRDSTHYKHTHTQP